MFPHRLSTYLAFILVLILVNMSTLHAQSRNEAPKEITNSIGMKLLLIPKGRFIMGASLDELGSEIDEVQHQVWITRQFYLGATEVTQAQYEKVMRTNPSFFQKERIANLDSSKHPVDSVLWEDAVLFCKTLSALPEEQTAGRVYRLPTESEWEYACRAGSNTPYSFDGDTSALGDYAWYLDNSDRQTHPVAQKRPNAWGLYDMHGNVWEWCSDWYNDYPTESVNDPIGPGRGLYRVYRGGSWCFEAALCRSAYRCRFYPTDRGNDYGFRVAVTISPLKLSRNKQ